MESAPSSSSETVESQKLELPSDVPFQLHELFDPRKYGKHAVTLEDFRPVEAWMHRQPIGRKFWLMEAVRESGVANAEMGAVCIQGFTKTGKLRPYYRHRLSDGEMLEQEFDDPLIAMDDIKERQLQAMAMPWYEVELRVANVCAA